MIKKIIYGFFLIILLFFSLSRFFGLGPGTTEQLASRVLYPFLSVTRFFTEIVDARQERAQSMTMALKEIEIREQAIDKLQKELIEARALVDYQTNIKEISHFLSRYATDEAILATPLLRHFDTAHFFLVDVGSKRGVTKDMIAVYLDTLVGKVTEVYPDYSKVMLITDPQCKVAAVCSETGTKGIHEGIGSIERTKLNFVDLTAVIKENDLVLTSGEGGLIPKGFGLGRIRQSDSDGSTVTVYIEPLINFKTIASCYLIKNMVLLLDEAIPESEKFDS